MESVTILRSENAKRTIEGEKSADPVGEKTYLKVKQWEMSKMSSLQSLKQQEKERFSFSKTTF